MMQRRDEFQAVVSFSHFVPRIELNPEKRYLIPSSLAKAVAWTLLTHLKGGNNRVGRGRGRLLGRCAHVPRAYTVPFLCILAELLGLPDT